MLLIWLWSASLHPFPYSILKCIFQLAQVGKSYRASVFRDLLFLLHDLTLSLALFCLKTSFVHKAKHYMGFTALNSPLLFFLQVPVVTPTFSLFPQTALRKQSRPPKFNVTVYSQPLANAIQIILVILRLALTVHSALISFSLTFHTAVSHSLQLLST